MSDPMLRRAAKYQQRLDNGDGCVFSWPNRKANEEPDHVEHHCRLLQGHYREKHPHRCPCGATKVER